jgi:hypothetical protein
MAEDAQETSVIKKLEKGAMDLAELEVFTLTGTITALISNEGKMDWSNLLKTAKTTGTIELVAATNIQIDGDTTLFVATGASEELKQAHLDATAAAQQYRQGLVQAFADLLGIKK